MCGGCRSGVVAGEGVTLLKPPVAFPSLGCLGLEPSLMGSAAGRGDSPRGVGGGCPGLCPILGWGRGSPRGGAVLEGSSGERGRAAKQLPFELGC